VERKIKTFRAHDAESRKLKTLGGKEGMGRGIRGMLQLIEKEIGIKEAKRMIRERRLGL